MIRIKNLLLLKSSLKMLSRNRTTFVNNVLTIKEMPRPTSLSIFGTNLSILLSGGGSRLHEYVDRRHKQLGPIYHEIMDGNIPVVFISDPVLIKSLFLNLEGKYPAHVMPESWLLFEKLYGPQRGLFFMDGEEWMTNRRTINKHLLKEEADKWLEVPIKQTVAKLVQKFKSKALELKSPFSPDLESEFYKLSTDVIINVLHGTESSLTRSKQYDKLLTKFSEEVRKIFKRTTNLYGFPVRFYQRANLKPWREFQESVDMSLQLGRKIVDEILVARHDSNGLVAKLCSEGISDDMVKRIAVDFVIAAGDTSTYTTLWTLSMLAENELIQEEIRTRTDDYIKNVLKESMRMYPVAPFLTRILPKESVLGSYSLKENTPIIASIYTSGRDEQNFSEATKFLPYRWDRNDPRKQTLKNHVPSASLPFALGSRSCVGKKIAVLQMVEVIKQIVNTFDFKSLNSSKLKPITSQVLVPNKPLKLQLSIRK